MDRKSVAIRVGNANPVTEGLVNPICKSPIGPSTLDGVNVTCTASARRGRYVTIEVGDEFLTFCELEVSLMSASTSVYPYIGGRLRVYWSEVQNAHSLCVCQSPALCPWLWVMGPHLLQASGKGTMTSMWAGWSRW